MLPSLGFGFSPSSTGTAGSSSGGGNVFNAGSIFGNTSGTGAGGGSGAGAALTGASTSSGGVPVWVWIVGGIAGVLILAALGIHFFRK